MRPKISVIVPVYNREWLVVRCLDSIAAQRSRPDELIVVDNNSTDNTYKTVEEWMRNHSDSGISFKLLKQQERGACQARQKGLDEAAGDFICFFDSDDEMREDLISMATQRIEENPDCDIVCRKVRFHLLDGTIKVPPFDLKDPIENHLIHALLRTQGYIVRKEFLEKAGGWGKDIKTWNDYELGLRLLLGNPKIKGIDKIQVEIYSQEDSITGKDFSSKEGLWEKTLEEMRKENEACSHPQKDRINKILNYREAILAAHYFKEGNKEGARRLMDKLLKNKSAKEKGLLKFAYYFTRRGFRGAWRIVRIFQ